MKKPVNRVLNHKNRTIQYEIVKNKLAKHIRISVQMGYFVRVTRPVYISDKEVQKFVDEKKDWIVDKMNEFNKYGSNENLFVDDKEHFFKYKEEALTFCREKIAYWNREKQFQFNTVKVKQVRSMWGSCSSQKNLNFNYKIIFLPKKTADSIIVHELCHLKELNHSPRFWKLVDEILNTKNCKT